MMKLKVLLPFVLLLLLFTTACELDRPPGSVGDISPADDVAVNPPTSDEAPATEPATEDVEEYVEPAQQPPAPDALEQGKLLIKLVEPMASMGPDTEIAQNGDDNTSTGNEELDALLAEIGATDIEPVAEEVADALNTDLEAMSGQLGEAAQIYAITIPAASNPMDVAQVVAQATIVEYAEPNYTIGIAGEPAQFQPNDPYYKYQWHLNAIQMPQAWEMSTGQGIVVAVIDTGVAFDAPDFNNTNRLQGYDFVNNDEDPTDDQGHGTHVAGTIAQSTNNGLGVTGVAPSSTILPIKSLGANGQGSYENIIRGIFYAVEQGAKVINMSLAAYNGSQALQDAVAYAHSQGVVVIAAAGNSNSAVQYPAAYDDFVIAVGATGIDNTRAPYSNFGPQLDLAAPGGYVGTDQNQDGYGDGVLQQTFRSNGDGYSYRFFEGTSMAAPHVAGVAALMLSTNPALTPAQIEAALAQTALPLGNAEEYGSGLIQAASALAAVGTVPVETPTTEATSVVEQPTETPATEEPTAETPTETPATEEPTAETPTETPTVDVPTATPTVEAPTATATPVLLPEGELVINGGFENDEGWVFGDTPIRGQYDSGVILSGARSALVGAVTGTDKFSYTSVWQRLTIPAEARQAILSANIYPVSQSSYGDLQQILVLNDRFRVAKTLRKELTNSQQWEAVNYDLSEFAGQTVYIYFGTFNTGQTGQLTALYVDDVSLTWAK